MPKAKKILAIVIFYFPDNEVLERLRQLSSEFDVLVIDNTEVLGSVNIISNKIFYIKNSHNYGVARALNQALLYASEHKYDWIVTFDQDSSIVSSYSEKIFTNYDEKLNENIAIIAPVWRRISGTSNIPHVDDDFSGLVPVVTAITSGSCVKVEAALAVGGFDDGLFIDSVDHDFCLKLKKNGYDIVVNTNIELIHKLGNETSRNAFLKKIYTTNHSPLRRYYISRNKIYLWCRHYRYSKEWVITDIKNTCKETIKILIFERCRLKKFLAIVLGICHASLCVKGELSAKWKHYLR
jgi:rhamnosyltransferase